MRTVLPEVPKNALDHAAGVVEMARSVKETRITSSFSVGAEGGAARRALVWICQLPAILACRCQPSRFDFPNVGPGRRCEGFHVNPDSSSAQRSPSVRYGYPLPIAISRKFNDFSVRANPIEELVTVQASGESDAVGLLELKGAVECRPTDHMDRRRPEEKREYSQGEIECSEGLNKLLGDCAGFHGFCKSQSGH